jgi:hypothetical protein
MCVWREREKERERERERERKSVLPAKQIRTLNEWRSSFLEATVVARAVLERHT